MTDPKLLPLPEALFETRSLRDLFNVAQMQGYARANVSHATAAKDAEIERLRAEVAAVWAAMPRDARYLDPPDGGCVPLHEQVRRMAADATQAERLAEALREVESELGPEVPLNHDSGNAVHRALSAAMAALNQEGKDG